MGQAKGLNGEGENKKYLLIIYTIINNIHKRFLVIDIFEAL